MIRGTEGQAIFREDKDRRNFLSRMAQISEDTGARIVAWVLMRNHPDVQRVPGDFQIHAATAHRRKGQKEESDGWILGSGDFVNRILRDVAERELQQTKPRRTGKSIMEIIREECRKGGVGPEELRRGNRRRRVSEVRAVIANNAGGGAS